MLSRPNVEELLRSWPVRRQHVEPYETCGSEGGSLVSLGPCRPCATRSAIIGASASGDSPRRSARRRAGAREALPRASLAVPLPTNHIRYAVSGEVQLPRAEGTAAAGWENASAGGPSSQSWSGACGDTRLESSSR